MDKRKGIIRDSDRVKVKKIRDELEVQSLALNNRKETIVVRRLCKGKHINIKTSEIIEDKVATQRGQSKASLIASNLRLKDIIKENTVNIKKLLLLTLTYKDRQTDPVKVEL
jgi:hypothetical protein